MRLITGNFVDLFTFNTTLWQSQVEFVIYNYIVNIEVKKLGTYNGYGELRMIIMVIW